MFGISAIDTNRVNFGRKLKESELNGYKNAINGSLSELGKDVGLIVHHSSAPSEKNEDTGIGSLYSEASRNLMIPFLNKHGFSSIQVEPEGLRKFGDPSPYTSNNSVFNPLMQDLHKLTTKEYGEILSKETFEDIVEYNPDKHLGKTNFDYANSSYTRAMHEAWENFKEGSSPEIKKLHKKFEQFKKDKQNEIESTALYEVLGAEHNNDYWQNWGDEIDKHLFEQPEKLRNKRINELKEKYADKIDYIYFVQMLTGDTRTQGAKQYFENGINTIGDAPVAFSDVDVWSHPNLFLKDYYMGCPPDFFSKDGQAWGFAVFNPEKLFDKKGNLGEGGEFLYKKYQKLFAENAGGVRIDHVLGLIDPFVYKNSPSDKTAGRLFSSENNPELKRFAKKDLEEFCDIMKKIVIPAAESVGLSKDDIICEDLGTIPEHVRKAFDMLGLRGINITQYVRNSEIPSKNIVMIGSHDSPTLIGYTEDLFNQGDPYNHAAWPLTEDVLPQTATHDEKQRYFDDMRFDYNRKNAKNKFMASKFAQLFTSPSRTIQIFWSDVLGFDKRYNTPGTQSGDNWTLRMNEDFEDEYYKNLEQGKGLNLPEVLEIALKAKGSDYIKSHKGLFKELEKYKKILKEKE